ncbi:hypothetical protein CBM2633_P370009 [Cupriavidus taiwanensis]|uniref:Uncharacterized protein n=2 Tax=Cupriavidus TaxID=106589 RepID=A0A375HWW4_9BURK|nr:hypothetical protein CBM2592_P390009 [Cupriavidus taiwanensis]SOZ40673.1 hypothetical protein CBM2605_P370009 [Cupriavidus neocaledonicus]SOY76394.1 hypothetical protein CBM2588_P410009 [Cupriavidus taiwanensis]SOZ02479.1 hypothetical protein CBM2600_P400009 [Cupriavidus taiwanensis]SOZ07032.1 hypothetical protein CBM2599_P370009 [Cupriavidus taiwanensis]
MCAPQPGREHARLALAAFAFDEQPETFFEAELVDADLRSRVPWLSLHPSALPGGISYPGKMVGFPWNPWLLCRGIAGWIRVE